MKKADNYQSFELVHSGLHGGQTFRQWYLMYDTRKVLLVPRALSNSSLTPKIEFYSLLLSINCSPAFRVGQRGGGGGGGGGSGIPICPKKST